MRYLALILFVPTFTILGWLYWHFPRELAAQRREAALRPRRDRAGIGADGACARGRHVDALSGHRADLAAGVRGAGGVPRVSAGAGGGVVGARAALPVGSDRRRVPRRCRSAPCARPRTCRKPRPRFPRSRTRCAPTTARRRRRSGQALEDLLAGQGLVVGWRGGRGTRRCRRPRRVRRPPRGAGCRSARCRRTSARGAGRDRRGPRRCRAISVRHRSNRPLRRPWRSPLGLITHTATRQGAIASGQTMPKASWFCSIAEATMRLTPTP